MKLSGIGGQAVIEGIMMRNGNAYAVGVRTPDGGIVVDRQEIKGRLHAEKVNHIPIVRGVVNFFDSLVLGMKTLMFSASLFAEESEQERAEREEKERAKASKKADRLRAAGKNEEAEKVLARCEEKLRKEAEELSASTVEEARSKEKDNDLLMTLTVLFSVAMSVLIFIMVPYFISRFLHTVVRSEMLILVLEGLVRLLIFIGYLALISRMKDIQRTFMYHGAEHKCINCIENGMALNVENVRGCSREHKRCGTSFLFLVMFVSIVFIMVFSIPLLMVFHVNSPVWRILLRLALMPLVAGVSYEFIRLAGRSNHPVVNALSKPGMWMQHLTTKEPDDSMIEVAIAAVEAVFDWKKFLEEYDTDATGEECALR